MGGAAAQYYPTGPRYLPPPGPAPYQGPPPGYDEDDMVDEPPGRPGAYPAPPPYPPRPYAVRPQPVEPQYGGRVPQPDTADAYPQPYGGPPPYGPPPPYGAPPPYRVPYGAAPPPPPSSLPGVAAADPDYYPGQPALRPPGMIGAPTQPDVVGTVPGQPPAVIGAPLPPPSRDQVAALPPDYQPEAGQPKQLPPQFRRQLVDYRTAEPAGTIVIDTPNTYLFLVLGNGKAMRYGIGVGREGFTWAGHERISKMQEWPDWHPPAEMIQRQPYLPRFMAGGDGNPLGARALYLGNTLYRIHGTNQPSTIGSFVSSGCIRLVNEDIEDLYGRVQVGTRVVVLPGGKPPATAAVR